jgi:hypothetical protein
MVSTQFILLVCSVVLLWIVALAVPLSRRESYSESHGFTLKYKTYATMETQTEEPMPFMPRLQNEPIEPMPFMPRLDKPIEPMPFMPRLENEPMPFFPDNSFETEEVKCKHGTCSKEQEVTEEQPEPIPSIPRMMKPPRADKHIEIDWFEPTDTNVVTLHDSNPFRI